MTKKTSSTLINGIANYEFKNWAETHSCRPQLYFEPNTFDEIKEIIELAKANEKKIKCVGCGHSPSTIACTNDYMISLVKLNRVVDIDAQDKLQISVEGGMTLDKLNKILQSNNLALSVEGSISDQTVAGALATGNHGTGGKFNILPAYVVELQMMLASGEIRTFSPAHNADEFKAVVLSLGSMGIVLTVRLQCERLFRLEQIEHSCKLVDILPSLDTHIASSDHFRMFWYPHTEFVRCFNASRSTKETTTRSFNWFRDRFIGYHLLEFLYWLGIFLPFIIPYINMIYFKLFNSQRKHFVDISYKVFNFDCLMKQHVYEAAIPRKETAHFLLQLKAWLENNPHVKVHNAVEIRFVKQDDIWLSPCYMQDTCYINILMFRPFGQDCDRLDYWTYFEKLVRECNGKPHWAKAHNYTKTDLEALYPKFNEFIRLRNELDPNELFMNECLEKIFK